MEIENIIKQLNLSEHPEGGYFKETYRSKEEFIVSAGIRNASTGIYYLLNGNNISHLHRIKSDEMWHFYLGSPLRLIVFNDITLEYQEITLSNSLEENSFLQFVVPAGVWMAAEVIDKSSFSLVGCTVSPGFDFTDFQMADKNLLENLESEMKSKLERYI